LTNVFALSQACSRIQSTGALVVSYKLIQLDVFTNEPFTGNALAVFPEAAGLSDEQMQRVALCRQQLT